MSVLSEMEGLIAECNARIRELKWEEIEIESGKLSAAFILHRVKKQYALGQVAGRRSEIEKIRRRLWKIRRLARKENEEKTPGAATPEA